MSWLQLTFLTIIDVFACKSLKNYILQAIEDLLPTSCNLRLCVCVCVCVCVVFCCFCVCVQGAYIFPLPPAVCERRIQGCIIAFVIDDNGVIFVLLLSLFFLGVFIYLLWRPAILNLSHRTRAAYWPYRNVNLYHQIAVSSRFLVWCNTHSSSLSCYLCFSLFDASQVAWCARY